MATNMSKHFPYPYLQVRCRIHDRIFNASGLVDTGFDGGLVIPASQARGLPEPPRQVIVRLGDGSITRTAEFVGAISLGNKRMLVTVMFLGSEYLIGRQIVDQLRLCFHYGRYLEIEE